MTRGADITENSDSSVVLLDISRSISRAAHPIPTGIDRVERAYIEAFQNQTREVYYLSRIAGGFAVLDRKAMIMLYPMLTGAQPWQTQDLIARFFGRKKPEPIRKAESTLRRIALKTCGRNGLSHMLGQTIPSGFTYLNVGHSNRKNSLWSSIRHGGATKIVAMIHDVIPLDYPEFSRPDTVARFRDEIRFTAKHCDCLIYNSTHTAERVEYWLNEWGMRCNGLVALLGVTPLPDPPARNPTARSAFVVLGTIEPRKNHRILLDIWHEMAETLSVDEIPHLHIVGQRGWLNKDIFKVLDSSPMMGQTVFEHNNLTDAELSALLSGARALLFPSFAEGFGYPLIEALQMDIPVICSDLACFKEIAGATPKYLDPTDKMGWKDAILAQSTSNFAQSREKLLVFPTWTEHFHNINTIL